MAREFNYIYITFPLAENIIVSQKEFIITLFRYLLYKNIAKTLTNWSKIILPVPKAFLEEADNMKAILCGL